MQAEIIAIGTEIVLGQLLNTNSSYIADKLTQIGVECHYQTNVDDDIDRIAAAITHALTRADIIICCGGLGPTQDDLTKNGIAQALGVKLVFNEALANIIKDKFISRGRNMSENNLNQAYHPENATILSAFPGTAPGLCCIYNNTQIFAVPGVPREMKEMLHISIIPNLQAKLGKQLMISTQTLKAWGLSESEIATRLNDLDLHLKEIGNPQLSYLASGINGIKIRLTCKSDDVNQANLINAPFVEIIKTKLGAFLYAQNEAETLEGLLLDDLKDKGLSLGIAESFTAGLINLRLSAPSNDISCVKGAIFTQDISIIENQLADNISNTINIDRVKKTYTHHQEALLIDAQTLKKQMELTQAIMPQSRALAHKATQIFGANIGISAYAKQYEERGQLSYAVALCVLDEKYISEQMVYLTQDLSQSREFCVINLLMLLRAHLSWEII
ncbi:hypothetical protein AwWohl_02110 [Gammaproteobacteria bacterium]|nr:hypothetical protein AwWohl_02110 [Gammaproteobacteria bacterium]